MSTTDTRTRLTMSPVTREALRTIAAIASSDDAGAVALLRAIDQPEVRGREYRIACDADALAFIRDDAPELARLWPAVFGDVDVPRAHVVALASRAIGQTVAGLVCDREGTLRLDFVSGDALLVAADGTLDWRGRERCLDGAA